MQEDKVKKITGLSPSCAIMTLFLGLDEDAASLDIPAANVWKTSSYEVNANMEAFRASDTGFDVEFPVIFFGSNSVKDSSYERRFVSERSDERSDFFFTSEFLGCRPLANTLLQGKHRGSVMVLAPVNYDWFSKWSDGRVHARGKDYDELKSKWENRMLEELYALYPKTKGHVVFKDLGTPLSNNYYLGVNDGEVYGMSHSVERFWKYSDELSAQTTIKGLYLTGPDILTAGIAGALTGGVLCVGALSSAVLASLVPNII